MVNPRKGDKNKLVRFVFFLIFLKTKRGVRGAFPPVRAYKTQLQIPWLG